MWENLCTSRLSASCAIALPKYLKAQQETAVEVGSFVAGLGTHERISKKAPDNENQECEGSMNY
jgi:hypothetical protein